jgi:hypothetical protein
LAEGVVRISGNGVGLWSLATCEPCGVMMLDRMRRRAGVEASFVEGLL